MQVIESISAKMKAVHEIVDRVAPLEFSVLITGESGVGKEVMARRIYERSHRTDQPFIKINSAAIPNALLESELFGYRRGAFTGASNNRVGRITDAHQGTLFFDEVNELSPESQSKLLHVFQHGEFTPLGTNEPIKVDVRVLAATNQDLLAEVERGNFRKDLFYRLNVVNVQIPPLRERTEEIPEMVDFFTTKYLKEFEKSAPPRMTNLDLELMNQYDWPGNVRELENFIRNFILFEDSAASFAALREKMSRRSRRNAEDLSLVEVGRMMGERVERKVIRAILDRTNWDRKKTAGMLNVSYRSLLGKIKKFNLA